MAPLRLYWSLPVLFYAALLPDPLRNDHRVQRTCPEFRIISRGGGSQKREVHCALAGPQTPFPGPRPTHRTGHPINNFCWNGLLCRSLFWSFHIVYREKVWWCCLGASCHSSGFARSSNKRWLDCARWPDWHVIWTREPTLKTFTKITQPEDRSIVMKKWRTAGKILERPVVGKNYLFNWSDASIALLGDKYKG